MISLETIKTFLIFVTLGGLIVLSINTFIMLENLNRLLENQELEGLPTVKETNKILKNIEEKIDSHIILGS